jgi:fucose permease
MVANIHSENSSPLILFFNNLVSADLKWVSLYWVFAFTCLVMIVVISFIKFPRVELKAEEKIDTGSTFKELIREKNVILYFIGIFAYVGTEQGVANWMSKFLQLYHNVDPATGGATAISYFWGLITVGCFLGLLLLRLFDSRHVLIVFAAGCMIALCVALVGSKNQAIVAFPAIGFFLSIMWSIVFSLGMNSVPRHHGTFSGILCTGIVGGAVVPLIIGGIAEFAGLRLAMTFMFLTLLYIFSIGFWARPLVTNSVVKRWSELFKTNA